MSEIRKPALYASVGAELTHYDLDIDAATLTRRGTVTLPANVHYCWPHESRQYLYAATSDSDSGVGGRVGTKHNVSAFRIGPDGALTRHGEPIPLPSRPIHMTTDIPSQHVLVAFSNPSGLRVYRINGDATLGGEVEQAEPIEPGIYAHQIRVTPDNQMAILVARGHDATVSKPEEPGALKIFAYQDGCLTNEASVAPNGGFGFGPRHLDFHPQRPWVYVSLERQNRLELFRRAGTAIEETAAFSVSTLAEPHDVRERQMASTVKVHPNGRFCYVANRASGSTQEGGRKIWAGGENSIVVFALDPDIGEPRPIQHIDTRGIHPRNFHIDPSGRILVVSHISGMDVREGTEIRFVPACLSVFRIGDDGRLEYARKYDVDVGNKQMFWMGMA